MVRRFELYTREPVPLAWFNKKKYPPNEWSLATASLSFDFVQRLKMEHVFENHNDVLIRHYEDGVHVEDRVMYWKYTSEGGNHVEEEWKYVNLTQQDRENLAWIWSVVHEASIHTVKELVHVEIDYWMGRITPDEWCKYIHNLQFELAHGEWLDRYSQ